ncbi:MAG: hypothetical protein HYX83_01970 [Chloroflexi bacterium]|nr:hypothetical protein [Chloroflexota bacterium]
MEVRKIKPAFEDERGAIIDILRDEWIDNVSMLKSRKGAVRGNHYHKDTRQAVYVLFGQVRLVAQMPGKEPESVILTEGDLGITFEMESHAFEILEDADMVVLTRGPRGGENYETDTYRLEVPLIPRTKVLS